MEEYRIDNCPADTISCMHFLNSSNLLVVSSWDKTVSLYDVDRNKLLGRYLNMGAVLSCDFIDADTVCLGGLDCEVKIYDFHKKHEKLIGKHSAAISSVIYVQQLQMVISGSWDKSVKVWDISNLEDIKLVADLPQSNKVYDMDVTSDLKLLVALDNRQIVVYHLGDLSSPYQNRECLLKYNTRVIRGLLDNSGFVVGSIEGRVGLEYYEDSDQNKPFSFRCHRITDAYGNEVIYPVNALAIHPIYGTLATGGADGTVGIWDGKAKKRLVLYSNYHPGVSYLCFNRDGTKLAIACSYTFEQGNAAITSPSMICIRYVKPGEVMPK